MYSQRRLYAVMIGLAAVTGALVALALSGGPRFGSEPPRRSPSALATATGSPNGTTSARTTATVRASPTARPSPTETASSSPSPDPLRAVRVLARAWRPDGTSAIVEQRVSSGTQLVAVPLSGADVTPLVELPQSAAWHVRLDGSAIAVALPATTGARTRSRIAVINFATGATSWVTPDNTFESELSPRWSNDGTVIYFTRVSASDETKDLGIYRIRPDGTNQTLQRAQTADRPALPVGLTPDGIGLVLTRMQAGGSLDILDLQSGRTRTYSTDSRGAHPESWRPIRPRALVSVDGPAVGPTQLTLWDDVVPTVTRTLVTGSLLSGADWDPTGTQVVAAMRAGVTSSDPSQLVTMDASGTSRVTLTGTSGASNPYWLRAGIVYLWSGGGGLVTEVRLAQPTGTAPPRTLYRGSDLVRLYYVIL